MKSRIVLAVVLVLAVPGCGPRRLQLPRTPDAIRHDAVVIADETKELLTYAREVRKVAESMTTAGVLPGATMDRIDLAAIALGKAADAFLARLPQVTSAAVLLAESQTLTDAVDRLFESLRSAGNPRLTKWVSYMDAIFTTARLFMAPVQLEAA